jgi:hypothetical protein
VAVMALRSLGSLRGTMRATLTVIVDLGLMRLVLGRGAQFFHDLVIFVRLR